MSASRNEWNKEIDNTLQTIGFTPCISDTCVYSLRSMSGQVIILALFVDDIIAIHSPADCNQWNRLKSQLMAKYKMTDNSESQFILGMKIERNDRSLTITQQLQVSKVLSEFNMSDCKSKNTPSEVLKLTKADCPQTAEETEAMKSVPYMSMVGSLLYLSLCMRPDIAFSVNSVSQSIQSEPR